MCKFRAVSEQDRPQVQEWIDGDVGHEGRVVPDFFLTPGEFYSVFAIEDDEGTVMYVREAVEETKVRLYVQFGIDKRRCLSVLKEAYPVVASDAKARGFKSIVFLSYSPALVKFMVGTFGFRADMEAVL